MRVSGRTTRHNTFNSCIYNISWSTPAQSFRRLPKISYILRGLFQLVLETEYKANFYFIFWELDNIFLSLYRSFLIHTGILPFHPMRLAYQDRQHTVCKYGHSNYSTMWWNSNDTVACIVFNLFRLCETDITQ